VGAQPTRGAAEQGKPAEFGRLYERWQQAKDPEQRIKLAEEVLALEPAITAWELAAPREHIKEELWFVIAKAYFDRRRGGWADNLEKAIVALEAALTVRTHEALPREWAATQVTLANAMRAASAASGRTTWKRRSQCGLNEGRRRRAWATPEATEL